MRARVISMFSPDFDLASHRPSEPVDDGFLLTMLVGPTDGLGAEAFDLIVCTPQWLERRITEIGRPLVGRHHLVVGSMDVEGVLAYLRTEVELIDAPTWSEVAAKVGRLGRWEFEDYRP